MAAKKTKSVRGTRKPAGKGVKTASDMTFHGPTIALRPPSKHHYVRINGPKGTRVYATNLVLRELSPLLLQDSITEALIELGAKKAPSSKTFSAGRGKKFSVRVNPGGEVHVQMAKEV